MNEAERVQSQAEDFRKQVQALRAEIGKVIVGNAPVVDGVITCVVAGSHALLEGVPGLGKTMLVRTLAECLGLSFSRIQFTPDLMPADITGTDVLEEDHTTGKRVFRFIKGPLSNANEDRGKAYDRAIVGIIEHRGSVVGRAYQIILGDDRIVKGYTSNAGRFKTENAIIFIRLEC